MGIVMARQMTWLSSELGSLKSTLVNLYFGVVSLLGEVLYVIGKVYFSIAGLYFIYAWYTNTLETFAYITGIIAIIFMVSNIKWYFFRK